MSDQDIACRPESGDVRCGPNPTGGRKRDALFYEALDRADEIPDLPRGADRFTVTRLLSHRGFAKTQGWRAELVSQLHFYISCGKPLDWHPGNLRIVWPRVSETAKELGVSEDTVRTNDRKLMLLGAIAFQDSANYARYGKRALDDAGRPTGPIVEACGIDLAPCALLLCDLQRAWAAHQAATKTHTRLLRRLSKASRHSRTALQQAEVGGLFAPHELEALQRAFSDANRYSRPDRLPLDALSLTCETVERFHDELAARIRAASAAVSSSNSPAQAPAGPVPLLHTKEDSRESLVAAAPLPEAPTETPERAAAPLGPERGNGSSGEASFHPDDIKGPAGEQVLEALSPRIARYLPPGCAPSMTEFVDAASRARRDMKINFGLWKRACERMSPEGASLALAHVAAKWDAGKVEKTPGAYFSGVFKSAIAGKLDLGASLWGMVKAPAPPEDAPFTPAQPPGPPSVSEREDAETGQKRHDVAPTAWNTSPAMPSLFPNDPEPEPGRVIAGAVVMRRFCAHMPDPERAALMKVWQSLVRERGQWPRLDEVLEQAQAGEGMLAFFRPHNPGREQP
ncbi:MAG: replication initiation protein RepC [Alphaproteobacteria bacterium]|nr:replication initiation protein RepC [Alphaproteobacteria bacterium]